MEWRFNIAGLWHTVQKRLTNRRFWHDSSLLMAANIIVAVLGLLRVPITTRILSKDEVGMLGIIDTLLPFIQLLSLPGLDSATYHYMAQGEKSALRINLFTRLRWSLLSVAGFIIVGLYQFGTGEVLVGWLCVIAGLAYPVTTGLTAVAGALAAQEQFIALFWYRIGEALTRYGGLLALLGVSLFSSRVLGFAIGEKVALVLLQVGVAYWLLQRLRDMRTPAMAKDKEREMLRYGNHLTALLLISTLQTRVDGLLVGWFLPLGVMADYSIAQMVQTQFKNLWGVYYSVRYPPFVRLPLARRRRRMVLEMGIIWVAFAVMGIILGFGLLMFIPIFLPSEYISSLPSINWLIAAFVMSVPGLFVEMYFRTCQNERSQYILRGAAAIGGSLIPIPFIWLWQIDGVLLGRFVVSLVFSALAAALFILESGSKAHGRSVLSDKPGAA